ncbi:MAG TPA: lytic transglycosylase domain-containing protein [Xanthobacteraceae bacterium]|nr:lytic transglycosylase domain-containing protein [Xanthobacteraceae bacterium]
MPAPMPGNIERSIGLAQWGAETAEPQTMSKEEALANLLDLARPYPAANTSTKTKTAMCETLATAAQMHDLPVGFFVRLIQQESGFNPEVVSPAGAQGVAQFMPKVAQEWGLKNPFDPHAALVASARFLRSLYNQFGNWGLAAAAYNGGMGRVQKWIDKRGKLPDETRHYVMTITGVPADKWVNGKPMGAKFSIPARAPCQEIAHLADAPTKVVPLPPSRTQVVAVPPTTQVVAGPPSKSTSVAVATVKRGTKVAVIKVKREDKLTAVASKTETQKAAVASAGFAAALPKDKRGQAAKVRVAEKSPAKAQAKAKPGKKDSGKARVRLADARK